MTYFEDLRPGEHRTIGTTEVTRDEALAFARSYDPQPFHLDDAAAAAHPFFGRLAISGWQTCALAMRLMVAEFESRGMESLGSPGVDSIRWLKPVYPGDRLTLEGEVLSARPLRSKPGIGVVQRRFTFRNQDGDTVMTMEAAGLFAMRPEA